MHRLTLLLLVLLVGARAQAVPAPVIHTREEYNNIPTGGKYWYNNRLQTKTETTALGQPRAELIATPTPAPTVYKNAPTVLTQKDLDAIPHGGKYWYQGRLLTKWGGTPAKDTAQAMPTRSTIWTEEESKAYFDPTPTPLESPASGTESNGVLQGKAVTLAMLIAVVILAMFIISALNYAKREPPYENEQIENEQVKRINFDELDRKMKDNDRLAEDKLRETERQEMNSGRKRGIAPKLKLN
jgi:hypothetical protein